MQQANVKGLACSSSLNSVKKNVVIYYLKREREQGVSHNKYEDCNSPPERGAGGQLCEYKS